MSILREAFIVDGHTRATNAAIEAAKKHALFSEGEKREKLSIDASLN